MNRGVNLLRSIVRNDDAEEAAKYLYTMSNTKDITAFDLNMSEDQFNELVNDAIKVIDFAQTIRDLVDRV